MRPRHRRPRGGNRCDFCAAHFVFKLYPCRNFKWDGTDIFAGPTGHWGACETCAGFIDGNEWAALGTRVMREVKKRAGITPEEINILRRDLRVLHLSVKVHLIAGMALGVQQIHYAKTSV